MKTKRCSKCGETKPVEAFSRCTKNPDGLNYWCKSCQAVSAKACTARRVAREIRLLAENPDAAKRCSSCKTTRRLTDFDRGQGQCKQCIKEYNQRPHVRARNSERARAYRRSRYRVDPTPWKIARARRRARLATVYNGDFTNIDWELLKKSYQGRCAYCGETPAALEMEHVIPLSRGGAHTTENIVPACRHCNAVKKDRTPEEAGMKFSVFPADTLLRGVLFPTYFDEVRHTMPEVQTTCPACLERKAFRFALCAQCFDEHGRDIADWPKWLQFLVRDNDRLKYTDVVLRENEISMEDMDNIREGE